MKNATEVMLSTALSPDTYTEDVNQMTDSRLERDDLGWSGARIQPYNGGVILVDLEGEEVSAKEIIEVAESLPAMIEDYAEMVGSVEVAWDELESRELTLDMRERLLAERQEWEDPEDVLAEALWDADCLDVPEHLESYAGVIYEQMARNMIAGGEAIITDAGIWNAW